jgi:hypothetical protein
MSLGDAMLVEPSVRTELFTEIGHIREFEFLKSVLDASERLKCLKIFRK